MKERFRQIYLEITNICNLQCPFCHQDNRKKEFMSLEDIKKIVLMCKPYTKCLYLHLKGEPLLHPEFKEILDYLDSIKMNIKITTNGDFLNKYHSEILKHNNILRMNISLQSLVTKDIKQVDEYLDNLVSFLKDISNKGTTSVSLRLWNNKDDLKVTEYNNHIKSRLYDEFGQEFIDSKPLTAHVYASIEDEFSWPTTNNTDNEHNSSCLGGSTHIGILVNRDAVLCCLDDEGKTKLGSLCEETLEDIIESDKFKKIVSDLRNGKYYFDICRKCTYRNRFK